MKKIIITLSICLAFVLNSNAQSQLTFNQVLLVPLTSQGDTVPQGKVWKVESALFYQAMSTQSTSMYTFFKVDSENISVAGVMNSSTTGSAYAYAPNIFPIWLPEGTIVSEGNTSMKLSIIEFNIQ